MTKISVIIPVYNAEKTLSVCIDSVLSQDYADFELLLVDDGSKDGSLAICYSYVQRDDRVRVFHKENGGVSSARNIGLDNAKGEWVTFVDSDDNIEPDYMSGLDTITQDIVFHGYKKMSDNICVQKLEVLSDFSRLSLKEVLVNYYGDSIIRCPWAKFFKLSLIGDIRFPEDMKVGEDTFFVFSYLARCENFEILPQSYYVVRVAEFLDEIKYSMSVEYAANSLRHLAEPFELLVEKFKLSRNMFLSYIGYFKRVSKESWKGDSNMWYQNVNIISIYKYVWRDLTFLQKTRFYFAQLLGR